MADNSARRVRAPAKEIFGWAMFDFANSAYTTVIITVVYAVVFTNVIVGDAPDYKLGNWYWTVALAASFILVVITAPIFGAIMDFSASKKKFLFGSYMITVIGSCLLYFATPGAHILAICLIIISNFGFATGENFASSFLPDLGPPEDQGKISGWAWGLGYFGGLISTAVVVFLIVPKGGEIPANFPALRWVGPFTGLFFLIAAIPTFLFLKEHGVAKKLAPGENVLTIGFKRLAKTMGEMTSFRDLMVFLIAVFFSWAGLNIVISFAFIYGAQVIGWSDGTKVIMFVITQLTAAGGAFLFGWLQDRIGGKVAFNLTLGLWIVAVGMIWGTPQVTEMLNGAFGTTWKAESVFLFVGSLAGLGLGATQSASRAIVGTFAPESKSAEFFGFWGQSGKLAAAFGVLGLGWLQTKFGLQNAILFCAVLFALALIANSFVNEKRGIQTALDHEGE